MKKRKKPGLGGGGKFYRIEVRPDEKFVTYRTQDVGEKGHLERLAGKRKSGKWDTAVWLVSKEDARVSHGKLVITEPKVKEAIEENTDGELVHVKGDIFHAHPVK